MPALNGMPDYTIRPLLDREIASLGFPGANLFAGAAALRDFSSEPNDRQIAPAGFATGRSGSGERLPESAFMM